jgi:hypothetical protein
MQGRYMDLNKSYEKFNSTTSRKYTGHDGHKIMAAGCVNSLRGTGNTAEGGRLQGRSSSLKAVKKTKSKEIVLPWNATRD